MTNPSYDLIGDIHGQHGKLITLLRKLGYQPQRETWKHPAGRQVVFLGDYIDRGPSIRETLHTLRGMVEAGDAQAIMGNHEYNAICAETPDGKGSFLRAPEKNRAQLLVTKQQFAAYPAEWEEWKQWMKALPLFLDLGALRAVHACWDAARIGLLSGTSFLDSQHLVRCATSGTPEHRAVQNVLKGPELAMPPGHTFIDKDGISRRTVRVRWWDLPEAARVSHLALPEPIDVPGEAAARELRRVPRYGVDEPPVFCGHYWLRPQKSPAPLAPNVACLDYSAASGDNPLVAYRWNGERVLNSAHYLAS